MMLTGAEQENMINTSDQDKSTQRRPQTGKVSSISGDKTISVTVESLVKHAKYGKYVRRHVKLAVHDAAGQAAVGDVVEIVPCRPVSKRKSWRLVRVVRSRQSDL